MALRAFEIRVGLTDVGFKKTRSMNVFSMNDAIVGLDLTQTLVAYLDPGSGSMVLQIVVAGLFSSIFFLKSSVGYFKAKLLGARVTR